MIIFLKTENLTVYKPTSEEFKNLMETSSLRLLYNGAVLYAWHAEEANHSQVRNLLRKHIADIDTYDGFMIEGNHLVCSLQNTPVDYKRFIKSYFPYCKTHKDKFGIMLEL